MIAPLWMIQLAPDINRLTRWAALEKLLHQVRQDDLGYAVHAALHAAFGTLAPQPWALMRDPGRPAKLLAYTTQDPKALHGQAMSFAEPDVHVALGLADLAAKPMPAEFPLGRRLGFALRIRPTIRTDRDGNRNQSRERDAFLAAITGTAPGEGPARGEVYCAWVTARLALDSYQRSIVLRRDKERRLRPIEGPEAGVSGILRVTDPAAFVKLLAHGVGRHAAFGFGMLLLRPV